MSSMTRITRALVGTAAAAAALIITATPASAVTRPYLDLPASQLADVTSFDISDTTITVDVTIPADVPAGNVWTYFHTEFPAGQFDHQYTDQPKTLEPLAAGQHYTLTLPVSTVDPCTQIDLVLVGPLNPTGQPYAADLTDDDVCKPGYTPPVSTPPTAVPSPPPTIVVHPDVPAAVDTQHVEPVVFAEQSAPAATPDLQTSSIAAPASLPVTGTPSAMLTTVGLALVALGFALKGLARAKRHGLL